MESLSHGIAAIVLDVAAIISSRGNRIRAPLVAF
jgi:hypothetical protein